MIRRTLASSLLIFIGCGGPTPELRTHVSPPMAVTVDPSTPPAPGTPRPYTLPQVLEQTLDNGLRVVLVPREGAPTVSMALHVDAGYTVFEGDLATPELLVRTLRDGAGDWDALQVAQAFDARGLEWESEVTHDRMAFTISGLATHFEGAVGLLATLVQSPHMSPERVEARRAEYVAELALASSEPSFHVERASRAVLFPADSPLSLAWPTVERVEAVDAAALQQTWRDVVGPANSRLVIVGDVGQDAMQEVVVAFGEWQGEATPVELSAPTVSPCNEAAVVVRPNSAQTAIVWLGEGTNKQSDDWFDALLANQVLGGGASARLFMNLREDKSYTYGAYSRLSPWGDGVFRATAMVRSDVTEPAISEFEYEFARFGQDALEADLSDAQAYLSGVFPIALQTNMQLASQLAALADQDVSFAYLESYRDEVNSADMTAVQARGATLFDRDELALVLVGERDVTVPAAVAHASVVRVYDLDGALIETLEGDLPSTCADAAVH